jgi:aminoglycoside phosphotransferase (APT) family kinase protein
MRRINALSISDPKIPHLDIALSRRKIRELLNREVLPATGCHDEVVAVKRKHTAYKPGKECLVLYRLTFGGTTKERIVSVTFGKPSRLRKAYDRYCASRGAAAGPPPPGTMLHLPEYPCLVEFFPTDAELPALAWAADPGELLRRLPQARAMANGSAHVELRVLRYRPRERCVLRYGIDATNGNGGAHLIAKVYPVGPKAGAVRRKLEILRAPARAAGILLPRLLDAAETDTLVLMEHLAGTAMNVVLERTRTETEAREAVGLAAAALASLHSLPFTSEESRSLSGEFEELCLRAARLRTAAPLLSQEVDAWLQELRPRVARAQPGALHLIHGDFKPSQLLVNGTVIGVVDLDRACLGDPAIDVGNFMAVLRKEALLNGRDHLRRLEPDFLAEYLARRPDADGLVARAGLFQCIALVRSAVRKLERVPHLYQRHGKAWGPFRLLAETATCLDAGRGS